LADIGVVLLVGTGKWYYIVCCLCSTRGIIMSSYDKAQGLALLMPKKVM